jgi:hypothetical protein
MHGPLPQRGSGLFVGNEEGKMNTRTALVPLRKNSANGLVQLREAFRQPRADGHDLVSSRFELEALEPRRLL